VWQSTVGNVALVNYVGAYGAAIYNEGTIGNITGTSFSGNESDAGSLFQGSAYAGAIYNSNSIGNIENCAFDANIADACGIFRGTCAGGAIYNKGTITTLDSLITVNTAEKGGGVYNEGKI